MVLVGSRRACYTQSDERSTTRAQPWDDAYLQRQALFQAPRVAAKEGIVECEILHSEVSLHVGEGGVDSGRTIFESAIDCAEELNSGDDFSATGAISVKSTAWTNPNSEFAFLQTFHGRLLDSFIGTRDYQSEKLGVYFKETDKTYTPRAIFTDLSPRSSVTPGIPVSNQIWGNFGVYHNWAAGYCREGEGLIDSILEAVRREAESCSNLQGFQTIHSLFGGSGGGLGSLVLDRIRDEYPEQTLATFSLLPSYSITDGVVIRPYNIALSLLHLAENADATVLFDYSEMGARLFRHGAPQDYTWATHDRVTADTISSVTASFRFPSHGLSDLDSFTKHMVSTPQLHYLTSVLAPLSNHAPGENSPQIPIAQAVEELCLSRTWTTAEAIHGVQPAGRCLSYAAQFRCQPHVQNEVDSFLPKLKDKADSRFAGWMPNNAHLESYPVPTPEDHISITGTGNFTCIGATLGKVGDMFDALYQRKAYLNSFSAQDIWEIDFQEARESLRDVVSDYSSMASETTTPSKFLEAQPQA